jgi:hypothetical protein
MTHRNALSILPIPVLVLAMSLGCASVRISDRERYAGDTLPRPGSILVHDFAVTAADLPIWSAARASFEEADAEQTPKELEAGRKLGTQVAEQLVKEISDMGLPAMRASGAPPPRDGDLVLVGYFTSVNDGSRLKRLVLGFGAGSAELKTHVEVYRMTAAGIDQLGSGTLDSGGGKGPGMIVPAIVTIATANPIGIAVGGAVKAEGELTGRSTIKGSAKRTASKVADELEVAFRNQGWID